MSWSARKRAMLGAALALAVATLAYDLQSGFIAPAVQLFSDPIDLLAFRCAGAVAAQGADPYRAEPLRTCESRALAESHGKMVPNLVVPAPLPPYAIALLEPLGLLSFRTAIVVWLALLFAAFAVTCGLAVRLTHQRLAIVIAALSISDFLASAVIGQVVPFVVCAAVATAALVRAGRPRWAAVAALATMLEPHLGLPLCLAMAVRVPQARSTLAAGIAMLTALSLATGGVAANLEYALRVLPAQERAEGLVFAAQYSLSALLAAVGVPGTDALAAGSVSYVAMVAAGIWLAGRLAGRTGDVAYVALVPIALALVGGPYVHIHQMAAAVPLALALFARAREKPARVALAFAVACLAVPWESLVEYGPIMFALFPHTAHVHVDVRHLLDGVGGPNRLAEDAWATWAVKRPYDPRTSLEDFFVKLPTWLGLGIIVFAAFAYARRARTFEARTQIGRNPGYRVEAAEP